MRCETEVHFLVGTVILGLLTILKKSQVSSIFEALNSASLSRCQMDVRSVFQMRWRPRAFFTISQGIQKSFHLVVWKISLHLSLCREIWPSFKFRAYRGPFHLNQKTRGPSHIHIPEGKLLLRYLWKDWFPLQSKTWNELSSSDDMWYTDHSLGCFTEIEVPLAVRWVSQGTSGFS